MARKIEKKITGYAVVKPEDAVPPVEGVGTASVDGPEASGSAPHAVPSAEVIQMHEKLERPEVLEGATYKIRSPLFEHALYVTINDIVLNPGTAHESRRPFEIFINSKNMEHFQWAVALTRILSAVFRKGGDCTFLVEELKAVFDPRGGYFKSGGVYMPSVVAELGYVIEAHLKHIGLLVGEDLSPEQRALIAKKRAEAEAQGADGKKNPEVSAGEGSTAAAFPASASICPKCHTKALVILDGCATCLNCGHSKCG